MTVSIQKWGNSHGIRLPKLLLESVGWSENEELLVTATEEGRLVIEKADLSKRKSINELFADYNGKYEPEEINWGEPTGNEVW